jgi:hypothetical protein
MKKASLHDLCQLESHALTKYAKQVSTGRIAPKRTPTSSSLHPLHLPRAVQLMKSTRYTGTLHLATKDQTYQGKLGARNGSL